MFGVILTHRNVKGVETFSERHFDRLSNSPDELTSVRLYQSQLNRDRLGWLCRNLNGLKSLEICRPVLVDVNLDPILYVLKDNDSIITLELSRCELNNCDLPTLKDLIRENQNIKDFKISHNDLNANAIGNILVELIAAESSNISTLDLSGNNVSDIHLNLVESLIKKGRVESLDLSQTNITTDGAEKLLEWFKESKKLREVYVNGCEGVSDFIQVEFLKTIRSKGSL